MPSAVRYFFEPKRISVTFPRRKNICNGALPSFYSTHMPGSSRSGLPSASATCAGVIPIETCPTDFPGTMRTSTDGGGEAAQAFNPPLTEVQGPTVSPATARNTNAARSSLSKLRSSTPGLTNSAADNIHRANKQPGLEVPFCQILRLCTQHHAQTYGV